MPRLFFLILLVAVLTLVQSFNFSILGVKPNLSLIAVIAASFFIIDIWEGFLLTAISAFLLKFSPVLTRELIVFIGIAFVVVILRNYLPWRRFLNNLILVALATFAFYVFTAGDFLYSVLFWKELFFNLLFGGLIFALLFPCGKMEKKNL